jgi:hypothetical protein
MKTLSTILLVIATATALLADQPTPSAGQVAERIGQYRSAVQKTLAELNVSLREVGLRGDALQIRYENHNESESDAFILALILSLARPLAGTSETVNVIGYRGKQKQLEVSAPPDDLQRAYEANLNAEELKRLDQLRLEVARDAGLQMIAVAPVATLAVPQSPVTHAPVPASEATPIAGHDSEAMSNTVPAPGTAAAAPGAGAIVQPQASAATPSAARPDIQSAKPTAHDLTRAEQRQLATELLDALIAAKLENITIGVDGPDWIVGFENRTYRSDIASIAAALHTIAAILPPVPLALEVKRDDVPVLSLRLQLNDYAALQGELLTPDELTKRWHVSGAPLRHGLMTVLARGNHSFGRVDIALRPAVHYEIGNEADPFKGDAFVVGNLDTTLARGWHVNVESSTRLTSGLDSQIERALLTKTGWLARGFLATGSVGRFSETLTGYYGELQWQAQRHRLGVVGSATSEDLDVNLDRGQAVGYYEYDWGELGLRARAGYGQFADNRQRGAFLSLRRQFGESVVAAEALRMNDGTEALNVRLSVPIGPKIAAAPQAVRLRSDRAFDIAYMSNLGVQGNYLQYGQDLDSFRGELSAPYLQHHSDRLADTASRSAASRWPSSLTTDGTSGLIRIPTADVIPDGALLMGASYMDRAHSRLRTASNAIPLMVGIGLLPNLELVGKLTILDDVDAYDWGFNMDRSFNAHYRLLRQRGLLPALAVGAQDVMFATTASYLGEAQYVVGTWEVGRLRLHCGVGTDRLDGVFGGLDYDLLGNHRLHLMADYDTEFVNAGLRAFFGNTLSVDIDVLGMTGLSGALIFHRQLR